MASLNEVAYSETRHSLKVKIKSHGRTASKIIVFITNIRKAAFCNAPVFETGEAYREGVSVKRLSLPIRSSNFSSMVFMQSV